MKSIYFKNFAATAAMVLFSFLILGTAFVFLGRSYVISEYRGNMVSNAEEVSHAAQALVRSGELTSWDLRMVISTLAQSTGNHIFITDTDGTVVSCSCRNIACEHLGRTLTGSAMTQLRSDGKLNLITSLGGFYSSAHYVVAQPINIGSAARIVGYVFVTTNSATIIDGWRTFVWVFLAASAAVMMIALLLSLVTSKRMAQPLDEMAVAAKKFAHGDFSARVTDDGRTDEVGALIDTGHAMANHWDIPKLISQLGTRIKGYHLHNTDGVHDLHRPMFEEGLWYTPEEMERLLRQIGRETPDADLVLEYVSGPHITPELFRRDALRLADCLNG